MKVKSHDFLLESMIMHARLTQTIIWFRRFRPPNSINDAQLCGTVIKFMVICHCLLRLCHLTDFGGGGDRLPKNYPPSLENVG